MARKEYIENTYQYAKMVFDGKLAKKEAAQELVKQGMKYSSAIINIDVFDHMLNGQMFTRTLSSSTFEYFLDNILVDFGQETLNKCLDALEQHIPYLEGTRTSKMHRVRKIYHKYRSIANFTELVTSDEEATFPEGSIKYRLHKYKERSRNLVIQAKVRFKEADPEMKCQVCEFSFMKKYGSIGIDFIEAHHVFPISELTSETDTKIEDLAMVCSNCHRMLHVRRPWLEIHELKKLLIRNT